MSGGDARGVIHVLCTWCGETATWILVADAAPAQPRPTPRATAPGRRGAGYRRSVAVVPDLVVDVRDGADSDAVDLRDVDEPIRRHER